MRLRLAGENLRWDVHAAREDETERAQHDFALGGLRNEAERAKIEGFCDALPVVAGGKHDDRNGRIALAHLGENLESVPIGQVQVEKDEIEIGVLLDLQPRLAPVRCLGDRRFALQLLQDAAQRLANQGVIVDDEYLHAGRPRPFNCSKDTLVPGPMHCLGKRHAFLKSFDR